MAPAVAVIVGTIISAGGLLLLHWLADRRIKAKVGSVEELGMEPEVDATLSSESEGGQAISAEMGNLINQIQQALTARKWRLAKETLSAFKHLGWPPDKREPQESVIYMVEAPGWQLAKRLDSYADVLKLHSVVVLIIATIWTGAVIGFLYSLVSSQDASLQAALPSAINFAAVYAAAAALGSSIYAYYESGRYGPYVDYLGAIFISVIAVLVVIVLLGYWILRWFWSIELNR